MVDFHKIPTLTDWGNISDEAYYPDNYHLSFFMKNYNELIYSINQPTGVNIIFSLYKIPTKPFHYYMNCVLYGILKKDISLVEYYSEFYLNDAVWAIQEKVKEEFVENYLDFIEPLEKIIYDIKVLSIETTYSIDEFIEIEKKVFQLIAKIKKSNNQ